MGTDDPGAPTATGARTGVSGIAHSWPPHQMPTIARVAVMSRVGSPSEEQVGAVAHGDAAAVGQAEQRRRCGAETTSPPLPEGLDLELAVTDDQLRQVAEAQNEAYGQDEITDHDVARLRGTVHRGGLVGLALDRPTGQGAGGGLCAPP